MSIDEALSVQFEPDQVLHFEGRGGRTFDYIEDETVMDRADAVLGLGKTSWEFSPVTDSCVKGTLIVAWPDGTTSSYQDFGYATRADSAEPYKEAVSDAIRRLGRFIGIARYLYHKHSSAGPSSTRSGNGRGAPPSPRPSAPPRTSTDVPEEPEFPDDFGEPTPIRPKTPPSGGGGWTFKELAQAAEDKGIAKNAIYQTADTLFGKGTKVTDLTGPQREQIAFEMGLVG